jgi:hypothetical protein
MVAGVAALFYVFTRNRDRIFCSQSRGSSLTFNKKQSPCSSTKTVNLALSPTPLNPEEVEKS